MESVSHNANMMSILITISINAHHIVLNALKFLSTVNANAIMDMKEINLITVYHSACIIRSELKITPVYVSMATT